MYCVYRIRIEEYWPGSGWTDDGCIYSADKVKLEREARRRLAQCRYDTGKFRAGKVEIVLVHETFLHELKTNPVLSTLVGPHPADKGALAASSFAQVSPRNRRPERMVFGQ